MFRRNFILVLAVFVFLQSDAQFSHLTFRHLTRSSGLPVDHITCLAQDSSGFIWIGSKEGLFRYDGFSFTAFYAQPGSETSLPENIITTIFVSRKGLIWVGTIGGGIACLNQNGKVITVINSRNHSLMTGLANQISDIKEDAEGNIWWTSVDGLYNLTENKLSCFKIKTEAVRGNLFNGLVFDKTGRIWLGGILGLRTFDPKTKQFSELVRHRLLAEKLDVWKLIFHGSRLWFSSWIPDLGSYDTVSKKTTFIYSDHNVRQPNFFRMSNQFYVDSRDNLWVANGEGLHLVKKGTDSISQSFVEERGNTYSLVNNTVNCLLEDREGNLWVGTEQGISITKPYDQPVLNFSLNKLKEVPFADKIVNHIMKVDPQTLLISTHYADGFYLTDTNFNVQKHFNYKDVSYDWAWDVYDDQPRNRILISTQLGMLVFDKLSRTMRKDIQLMADENRTVSSIAAISDSIIWMSKFRNFFIRYNLVNGSFRKYDLRWFGFEPQVIYLSAAKDGAVWIIAHQSGIFRFDEKTGRFTDSLKVTQSSQSLRQTNVMFVKDLGNYLLIGYKSKGISLYDTRTRQYQHFTQAEGLVSNNTNAVWPENDHEVWIATTNGLSYFNTTNKTFKNYDYGNGMLSNDFRCVTSFGKGKLAAGTSRGIAVFMPDLINANQRLTPPFITEMSIYGKSIPLDSMQQRSIEIAYDENYFSFDYISLQYQNNDEIEYAYKLDGFDKDWVYAGKRRFASYSNIKGGNYQLKVKARRPGEEWVEIKNPLTIKVHSAFYTQWWFYVLSALLVSAIVYAIFRYRVQQVLKVEKMRTSISSDLHDEVGASLTSISIFSEMARRSTVPSSKEEEYLVRIGDRSRESIEKMSDIIWSINPDNDSLQQMLVRMKNYATEITEASDIAVHWTELGNLSASKLSMEQRKNFYLLFKEVMNNSIKHANACNIEVTLSANSNLITMIIHDDGKGFDRHQIVFGNGIKSIERRAAALEGSIKIDSAKDKGTKVQLAFRY